jgi:hypothetical protein
VSIAMMGGTAEPARLRPVDWTGGGPVDWREA